MTKIYSTGPYYDDFADEKGFHQIMFKPGYAVQSRELTQMQTILRKQIERFGNHVFKNGSVVIPGNSFADLNVSYVSVASTFDGVTINPELFLNRVIVGATSGVRASVKYYINNTSLPTTFYISYISGGMFGSTPNGFLEFLSGEELYIENASTVRAVISDGGTGRGQMAFINEGVYYVNGAFAFVPKQQIVIDAFGSAPNCHILLQINEQIIDETTDETLLDPAQGSYNYAAPGADRVTILMNLVAVPIGSTLPENSIELMRYVDGELQMHSTRPKYSELDKALAERTFDESGNYIVNGFSSSIKEHTDSNKMVYEVSPGKAYVRGFIAENQSKKQIVVDRARTAKSIKTTKVDMRPTFGSYIFVQNIKGGFAIKQHEEVTIWESADALDATAVQIGTAKVYGIDYHAGDPVSANAIYKVWLYDIKYEIGHTSDDIGGLRFSGGQASVCHKIQVPGATGTFSVGSIVTQITGAATVSYWEFSTATLYIFRHTKSSPIPVRGEVITSGDASGQCTLKAIVISEGLSSLIFNLPKQYSKSIKTNGLYELDYTAQSELTITTDPTGAGSTVISTGTIDPIEVGTFLAFQPSGVVSNSLFQLPTTTTLQITGGPASQTIKIYCNINKKNIAPRIKTRATKTLNLVSQTGDIELQDTDIIRLISIVDSVGDITNRYELDNGQRDYIYLRGLCKLNAGSQNPSGAVTVTYEHYEHGAQGDFFCVDSYESDPTFLSNMPVYIADNGYSYNLSQSIDFRPSAGASNSLLGVGAKRNDIIQTATSFITNLDFFVGRMDVIVIDSTGVLSVVEGIPAETPILPNIGADKFGLDVITVQPYTRTPDSNQKRRVGISRKTMGDIDSMSKRIDRLENYATITQDEADVLDYEILDAESGLSRFKTGYLVESFDAPLNVARTTTDQWSSQFIGKTLSAGLEELIIPLEIYSTNNVYNNNGVLTKNFAEVPLIQQPLSSRVTNLNPFLVISWNGNLQINPVDDVWVDILQKPNIFESRTEFIDIFVPAPPAPPAPTPPVPPPAPAPAPIPAPVVSTPPVIPVPSPPPPVPPAPPVVVPPPQPPPVPPPPVIPPAPPVKPPRPPRCRPAPPVIRPPIVLPQPVPPWADVFGGETWAGINKDGKVIRSNVGGPGEPESFVTWLPPGTLITKELIRTLQ